MPSPLSSSVSGILRTIETAHPWAVSMAVTTLVRRAYFVFYQVYSRFRRCTAQSLPWLIVAPYTRCYYVSLSRQRWSGASPTKPNPLGRGKPTHCTYNTRGTRDVSQKIPDDLVNNKLAEMYQYLSECSKRFKAFRNCSSAFFQHATCSQNSTARNVC